MDDLISRTWLLAEYDKRHKGPSGGARKLIEEAPSALGTNLAEVGTDCISRRAAITQLSHNKNKGDDEWELAVENDIQTIWKLPSIQTETSKRIIGKSRGGMTLWYQCNVCNEPVDEKDAYCSGCGRRLIDG